MSDLVQTFTNYCNDHAKVVNKERNNSGLSSSLIPKKPLSHSNSSFPSSSSSSSSSSKVPASQKSHSSSSSPSKVPTSQKSHYYSDNYVAKNISSGISQPAGNQRCFIYAALAASEVCTKEKPADIDNVVEKIMSKMAIKGFNTDSNRGDGAFIEWDTSLVFVLK